MSWDEYLEPIHDGEYELKKILREAGFKVKDVSEDPHYFHKDIDLIATSPITFKTTTIEVKADYRMSETGNFYIEVANPRSKGGKGWFKFCEADILAYEDAINKKFYFIAVAALKTFIDANHEKLSLRHTSDGSYGYLVKLNDVIHLCTVVKF